MHFRLLDRIPWQVYQSYRSDHGEDCREEKSPEQHALSKLYEIGAEKIGRIHTMLEKACHRVAILLVHGQAIRDCFPPHLKHVLECVCESALPFPKDLIPPLPGSLSIAHPGI